MSSRHSQMDNLLYTNKHMQWIDIDIIEKYINSCKAVKVIKCHLILWLMAGVGILTFAILITDFNLVLQHFDNI